MGSLPRARPALMMVYNTGYLPSKVVFSCQVLNHGEETYTFLDNLTSALRQGSDDLVRQMSYFFVLSMKNYRISKSVAETIITTSAFDELMALIYALDQPEPDNSVKTREVETVDEPIQVRKFVKIRKVSFRSRKSYETLDLIPS